MANRSADATVPAHGAVVVTPSDSVVIGPTRALYIGATGNVAVLMDDQGDQGGSGTTVIFASAPVGILPIQVRKVLSTGTTASSILALY